MDSDIFLLTETWLSADISDTEVFHESYTVLRKDRDRAAGRSTGGGVLVAASDNICICPCDVAQLSTLCTLIDLVICKYNVMHLSIYLVNVYIPPYISYDDYESFIDALALRLIDKKLVICGDFNCPMFNSANNSNDRKYLLLKNFMNTLGLSQFNNAVNSSNRLLDLVFSNLSCPVFVTRSDISLVSEDIYHPTLNIQLELDIPRLPDPINFPSNSNLRYNFRKANFPALYGELSYVDWSFIESCTNVNLAISFFYTTMFSIIDKHVPKYTTRSCKFPVWYTPQVVQLLKLKEFYHKKWKTTQLQIYKDEFSRVRTLAKVEANKAYDLYRTRIEHTISSDPKAFWKFISQKAGRSRIPGCMKLDDKELTDAHEIVETFARNFAEVYRPPALITTLNLSPNANHFQLHSFTCDEVRSAIERIKGDFTSGHDGLPNFLIRDCALILCSPLCLIFNIALRTSTFPDAWKISRINPIFKKGSRSDIQNYRPVAILSSCSKIFEHLLQRRLYDCIRCYISPQQHGFMRGRSTISNLAEVTQYISSCIDSHEQVDVLYTDFAKAFDTIDHGILLSKLAWLGFSTGITDLIASYLDNRSCYVCYNGYDSTIFTACSGVPQGSNLGPLLFNVYINDLLHRLECKVLAYADDLKIFRKITSVEDCEFLQRDLYIINDWCNENRIKISIDKCAVVTYTTLNNPLFYRYNLDNITIPRLTEIRDLGVLFDQRLQFSRHIATICSSAMQSLNFIIRSCRGFTNTNAMKMLYYAFVRSKLEYASLIWYPLYTYQTLQLERVQKRFLKYMTFKICGTYPPRGTDYNHLLTEHNFVSLSSRRESSSANYMIKLINNQVDAPELLSLVNIIIPRYSTRSTETFSIPKARTNVMSKSPIVHMSRNANKIFSDPFHVLSPSLTHSS